MKDEALDPIDMAILDILQKDARCRKRDIARQLSHRSLGIDNSTVGRRVKRLEDEKYILGYQVRLNRAKLDITMTLLIFLTLTEHRREHIHAFETAINKDFPSVVESFKVSGAWDFVLKTVARNRAQADQVQEKLLKLRFQDKMPLVHRVQMNEVDMIKLPPESS